jgi:hypothetical protein
MTLANSFFYFEAKSLTPQLARGAGWYIPIQFALGVKKKEHASPA